MLSLCSAILEKTNPLSLLSLLPLLPLLSHIYHHYHHLPHYQEDLAVFVEGMKQKDSVNKLMGIIRSDVPEIYNALIGERDLYMANSLNGAASQSLMAVVGLAHVNGIEGYLKGFGFQPLALKACPPPKV
mmetsp:Transcript_27793/g.62264  ORF Transcript_27793/g.62264 Transcript_27793/m.62264 type:complete len:130 (-) Transcript_27793:84-473(-)